MFDRKFQHKVLARLDALQQLGAEFMAKVADLDAALDTLGTAITDAATQVTTALNDLTAKVQASGASIDVQPEVDRVNALTAKLTALGAAASAADPATAVPAAVAPAQS